MQRWWCWIFAIGLTLQACATEHVAETPVRVTLLTPTMRSGAGEGLQTEARRLVGESRLFDPVVRISSRLIAAAQQSEYASRARAQCWVIAVYDGPERLEALVRPDGGIIVSTGAFGLAESEAGLAALLGHELAHALASETPPSSTCVAGQPREASLFTYQEELRADELGLQLMADAGYDPREMLRLWERMRSREHAVDQVFRHVTYDRRMEHIGQRLPQALIRYERANRAPQKALPSV